MEPQVKIFWEKLKNMGETVSSKVERIRPLDRTQATSICYFLKLQNTVNSVMILLDRHLNQDAEILCRSLFENMVYLHATHSEEHFYIKFIRDNVGRRKVFRKDLEEHFASGNAEEVIKQRIEKGNKFTEKIEATIPEGAPKKGLVIGELAKNYGMEEEYKLFYQHRHDVTHSLPESILAHRNNDEFISYPKTTEIELTARGAFWMYMFAIGDILEIFKLDEFKDRLIQLQEERLEGDKLYHEKRNALRLN